MAAVSAAVAQDFGASVPHALGATERQRHCRPPNISWVLGDARFGPGQANCTPRQIATLVQEVSIECWGRTFGETWNLVHIVRRALHNECTVSVKATACRWVSQTVGSVDQSGEMAVISVTFDIPILDRAPIMAPITSIEQSSEIEND